MGIAFTHCNASWSYSGFNQMRTRLALEIGVRLAEMRGFGGDREWSTIDDPIVPFLNHSDCDGALTTEECAKVAPRLREIIEDWPDDYDRSMLLDLIGGMELAARDGETLLFT